MSRAAVIVALVCCGGSVSFRQDTAIGVIAPPLPAPAAIVQDGAIVVLHSVGFGANAEIEPTSFYVLDEVASLSKRNPSIKKIVVEHSALSLPRTEALLAYLVRRGVAQDVEIVQ